MGSSKSGLFHASIRAWFKSTMVTWIWGHLSAMTAQVGPPGSRLAQYKDALDDTLQALPTYPAPTVKLTDQKQKAEPTHTTHCSRSS